MLADLVRSIEWRHSPNEGKMAVVLDASFAEALKWNLDDAHLSSDHVLVSLNVGADTLSQLSGNISRVLVFTSKLSSSITLIIQELLRASGAAECCILSSVSAEAAEFITFTTPLGSEAGYQGLQELLLPVRARVTYFPLHTVQIITPNAQLQPNHVSLGVLAAHSSRTAQPVTLATLRCAASAEGESDPREYESVLDVNAADLPGSVKKGLKALAHDLAGALVFDYDLDVSASVHALGKTSSILGHNLLPVLDQLVEQRNNRASERRTQSGVALRSHLHYSSGDGSSSYSGSGVGGSGVSGGASPTRGRASVLAPLQPAALVLIDRSEDLLTPASAGSVGASGGATPLAHRVLNTLNYCQYLLTASASINDVYDHAYTGTSRKGYGESKGSAEDDSLQCDVTLRCPLLEVVELDTALSLLGMQIAPTNTDNNTTTSGNWNVPMSALANLPLQLTPSLLYKPLNTTTISASNTTSNATSNTTHPVVAHLLAGTEEAGRAALCGEIKTAITANSGVLPPPKKRGLGAEMLAYAQALIAAPGSGTNNTNNSTATPLLSLTYTVIECMQRSSQKQLPALCSWQCAYDVRTAREAELNTIAVKIDDYEVCVAHLCTYFISGSSTSNNSGGTSSTVSSPKRSTNTNTSASGGLDRVSSAKSVVSEKEAPSTAGPVDVVHILVQLLRLTSLFRQRHRNTSSNSGTGGSTSGNLNALTECLCDYLIHKSCPAELQYLQGLRFLSASTLKEVLAHRHSSAELDLLYSAHIHNTTTNTSHTTDSDKIPTASEGIESRIALLELGLKQLHSSIRDQVTHSLHTLYALQQLYVDQRNILLGGVSGTNGTGGNSGNSVSSGKMATNECLDLLSRVDSDGEVVGLVARIAQAYLAQRSANLSSSANNSGDPLSHMFEFIETPLQQVKRAGLGLLSKGLGSFFGSQVASVATTPHPVDQPILVLFVFGGISYKEVGQVQCALSKYAVPNTRVLILSTRLLSAENVLYSFFC